MRDLVNRPLPRIETVGAAFSGLARAAAVVLVAMLPLVVTPWGEDGYNQIKALMTYTLAGLALLGWVGTRVATGRPRWKLTRPEVAVWAFLLAVLLSTVTSVNARLSFFGAPRRYEGLFSVCSYIVLFFAGVHFFGSRRGWLSLTVPAGIAAAIVIGYGVVQIFIPPLFAGEAFVREWYGRLGVPRIPSTLGSPVVFGGYLCVMLPLLLALAMSTTGRGFLFWLTASCLGYVALALTLTRAAWLAVAVGTGILALALGREVWRRQRTTTAAVVGAIVTGVVILLTVLGSPGQIGNRVASSVDASSGSLSQRFYMWGRTITLIRARPLLGWGLETLGEIFPYDRPALVKLFGLSPVIVDKAHNDVLQVAVSIGIPGTLAYLALWAGVVAAAFRLWKHEDGSGRILAAGWLAAIVAYLVQVQFSFSAVALAPLVWLLAGSACGWEAEQSSRANHDGDRALHTPR